jgi:iron complex transport system ATP-binding protein
MPSTSTTTSTAITSADAPDLLPEPQETGAPSPQASFRVFDVAVVRVRALSPNLSRFTLGGSDLEHFAVTGYDQRIKLILPLPGVGLAPMPRTENWYGAWRALPPDLQNPIRTYTVRSVRREFGEIAVDIVMHGDSGPASAWASTARPGDPLIVVGPNHHFDGECGGVDFAPPAQTGLHLLIGDETALPAIAAILEKLAPDARGIALVETPHADDRLALGNHPGIEVRLVARGDGLPGSALVPAVKAATDVLFGARVAEGAAAPVAGPGADAAGSGSPRSAEVELDDVDVDSAILWDVPGEYSGIPLCDRTDVYAWVAAEAGVVKELRRHFVRDCGLDRSCAAFMGYWRLGRADLA